MKDPQWASEIKLHPQPTLHQQLPSVWGVTEATSFFVPLGIQQMDVWEIKSNEPRKELLTLMYFFPPTTLILKWKMISLHTPCMPWLTWLNCHGHFPVGLFNQQMQGKGRPKGAPTMCSWSGLAWRYMLIPLHSFTLLCWAASWAVGTMSGPSAPLPHQGNTDTMTCTHWACLGLPLWAHWKGEFS